MPSSYRKSISEKIRGFELKGFESRGFEFFELVFELKNRKNKKGDKDLHR